MRLSENERCVFACGEREVLTSKQEAILNLYPTEGDRALVYVLLKLCDCTDVGPFYPTLLLMLVNGKKGVVTQGREMICSLLLGVEKGDKLIDIVVGKESWSPSLLHDRLRLALQIHP